MVKELLDGHRGAIQSSLAVLMRGVNVSSHTRPQAQMRCGRANVWVVGEGRNGHRVRESEVEEMTEGYIYSGRYQGSDGIVLLEWVEAFVRVDSHGAAGSGEAPRRQA